jgi:hypothetical protein
MKGVGRALGKTTSLPLIKELDREGRFLVQGIDLAPDRVGPSQFLDDELNTDGKWKPGRTITTRRESLRYRHTSHANILSVYSVLLDHYKAKDEERFRGGDDSRPYTKWFLEASLMGPTDTLELRADLQV